MYLLVNIAVYDIDEKKIACTLSFMKKGSALACSITFSSNTIANASLGTWNNFMDKLKVFFLLDLFDPLFFIPQQSIYH